MARNIILVAFMVTWGASLVIMAVQNKGVVPPEYWTIPAIGLGAIMGAFSAWEDRRGNGNKNKREDPEPEDEGSST